MADTMQTQHSNTNEPVAFDERTRRVLELRRRVRAGLYQPGYEEIARAILAEWTALGSEIDRPAPVPAVESPDDRRAAAAHFVVAQTTPTTPTTAVRTA